jgi:hypothetical protein
MKAGWAPAGIDSTSSVILSNRDSLDDVAGDLLVATVGKSGHLCLRYVGQCQHPFGSAKFQTGLEQRSARYDHENVDPTANRLGVAFLFTECDLAVTFLNVADNSSILETVLRNRKNARKAYDTILRNMPKLVLNAAESQSIERKLSTLRTRMEAAGEQF